MQNVAALPTTILSSAVAQAEQAARLHESMGEPQAAARMRALASQARVEQGNRALAAWAQELGA